MLGRAAYKFEEFYRAFGRSVSADVVFADAQVHIVPRDPFKRSEGDRGAENADDNGGDASPGVERECSPPRSPSVETDTRLPECVAALLELQEPDGSWKFSDAFRFVLNGVAPEPINGISGKLWATAVALNVWRQSPEFFPQLEFQYNRALLHADENVLRVARAHLDLTTLDKVTEDELAGAACRSLSGVVTDGTVLLFADRSDSTGARKRARYVNSERERWRRSASSRMKSTRGSSERASLKNK